MIKLVGHVKTSAIWEIDGTRISFQYRKDIPEAEAILKIVEYKAILHSKSYMDNNASLCEMFRFFGGLPFVKIGMVYEDAFLSCFAHYAGLFALEWAAGERCLRSRNIGYRYVFDLMLESSDNPIQYNFQHILDDTPDSIRFCKIVNRAFEAYWIPVIEQLMRKGQSLNEVRYRIADSRLSRYMMNIPEETGVYVVRLAKEYTKRRELISLRKLHKYIFGGSGQTSVPEFDKRLVTLMKSTVDEEYEIQFHKFITENQISMDTRLDKWILYQSHGVTLQSMSLDFTQIKQPSLKHEIKCFIKNRFSGAVRTTDGTLRSIVYAVNQICENNPSIRCFADIDTVDVKMLQLSMETDEITQNTIIVIISACRMMMDYLCGGERDKRLKTPVPHHNPFQSISLVNRSKFLGNTPYIPDCVLSALEKHLDELNEMDQLVFRIFNETGMRAKEVAFLQENCLQNARYDGYVRLRYIQYKTLNARRRARLNDCHSVYISPDLALSIAGQIKKSEEVRKQCGLPYIFLHQRDGYKTSMYCVPYFLTKVNDLIQKHNICDESGNLWHFTSRQSRKTLIVNMIENGAAAEELVYQLGHLNRSTVMIYYAEVREKKLAELNSEFFKKQFEIGVSNEQLREFTEEERRLLYVDLQLGYRRVEMGFCIKKMCDGACKHVGCIVHCVNCPNLCTGKKYLSHWQNILDSEQNELEQMLEKYRKERIEDYYDFIEFKQKTRIVHAYQDMIRKIEGAADCERRDESAVQASLQRI